MLRRKSIAWPAWFKEHKSDEEIGKVMMAEYGWMPNSLNMQWSLPGFKTEFR